jgi:hypothetical protein
MGVFAVPGYERQNSLRALGCRYEAGKFCTGPDRDSCDRCDCRGPGDAGDVVTE